jgi:hypothetical protein
MNPEMERWVEEKVGAADPRQLFGDASGRRFYRVSDGRESYVVMDSGKIPLWPWLDIHSLLEGAGLPVPEVLESLPQRGWVIQEDLGDTRMLDLDRDALMKHMDLALDLLAEMQAGLPHRECSASVAGRRYFTPTFFMAELEHTLEHLFFRLLRVPMEELETLQLQMRELCGMLEGGPRSFSHRDFHSANLMVTLRGLVMVDWQDARFGPPEYDLVSLLRDSYVDIGPVWREKASRYIQSRGDSNMFRVATAACQRSLKAAGTFAYQFRAFGESRYLSNLPRTLRYLAEYADICPRLDELVGNIYRIADSFIGEIDLRGFRSSDRPVVNG